MRKQGFTVIEVLVVSAFLIAAGVVLLFQIQRMNIETTNGQKRVAINAMYYSLEEAFYPEHKFYPEAIDKDTLKTMDSSLLTDPNGKTLGDSESAYRYEPKNCQDGKCSAYTLRAIMENEEDFVKTNR